MNIKEYIESGILEAFVLGELNETEMAEVLNKADTYPEIREEINRIEMTLESASFAGAVQPPEKRRDDILKALKKEKLVKSQPRRLIPVSLAAAVAGFLLMSLIINGWLYFRLKETENRISGLLSEKQLMAENIKQREVKYLALNNAFENIHKTGVKHIYLEGTDNLQGGEAEVHWNQETGELYLSVNDKVKADNNHDLQLWAIVDGKPVSAGIFHPGEAKVFAMTPMSRTTVQLFAVTLEPKGGSVNPTLEQMVLKGSAG